MSLTASIEKDRAGELKSRPVIAVLLTLFLYGSLNLLYIPFTSFYADVAGINMGTSESELTAQLVSHNAYLLSTIGLSGFFMFVAVFAGTRFLPKREMLFAVVVGLSLTTYCLYRWFFANMFQGFPLLFGFAQAIIVPNVFACLGAKAQIALRNR